MALTKAKANAQELCEELCTCLSQTVVANLKNDYALE
jgi:hypothetical protein